MIQPSTAVSMKFALVLMMLTRTVLLANVRARVKRPHMIALNAKFMRKKNYVEEVRNAVSDRLASLKLQPNTYASHERFNDHALFFHAKEIRPLFKLGCCGHFGKDAVERRTYAR